MGSRAFFFFFIFLCVSFSFRVCECGALVPAIYVFGDSLVDVGNNNHLKLSLAKANFPHNGIDFPTTKPTGRFSNGKNAADYLAEKVGLPTSPPYLSLVSKFRKITNTTPFKTGVSFASGGAGIFNETNNLFKQSVAMGQQIDFYSSVYQHLVEELGSSAAQVHLSKSLFTVVIGSNDIFGYHESSDLRKKYSPQQYVDLMASTLESQLKRLYSYGARKYVIGGVGLVGCTPSQRKRSRTGECDAEVNSWVEHYNFGLKAMLGRLKMELNGIAFSYFDAYAVMSNFIRTPSSYGFTEIRRACCGLGNLNADVPCLPIAAFCSNRNDHLFWDLYHPTQEAHRLFGNYIFDGPFTYALNVKQLIAL
ncbi:GDSL esterase/lipase At5g55050-like [Momordica charantia]|uniref:GDSL esterase/lipase At5g55050-like n=1 Tax=Momordica charantia TaxID=3673 RepID=A0A6J1DE65_MOMCH|nr:GDSL esterase/lipase At5g55050-like [Momordica charantia]